MLRSSFRSGLGAGLLAMLLRAPDDGGGTGGGDPPPGGGAGDPPPGGGGNGDPPAFTPPDFLPEHLRGKDPAETLAKLAPDWKAQRDGLAQRWTPPPDKPEAYEFAPAAELKQFFADDPAKDPVVGVLRGVAHKIGMSADRFAPFVNDAVAELQKAGLIGAKDETAVDYAKEWPQLVPDDKKSLPEPEQKAAAKARLDTAQAFADTLKSRGDIDEGMHGEFGVLLETAAGVRLVEFMISGITKEKGFVFGGQGGGGGYTMADYNRDSGDPRYSSTSPKYDPAFRADVDAKAKPLWR